MKEEKGKRQRTIRCFLSSKERVDGRSSDEEDKKRRIWTAFAQLGEASRRPLYDLGGRGSKRLRDLSL